MSKIKYFSENLDIQSKTIILRLDLNVPLNKKEILDKTRILVSLPLLNHLIKRQAKIVIISHLGRPKGIANMELSLAPIYKFLKEHLEKQFKPGMNWSNHSLRGWHIDHIRPLSKFDCTDPKELKKACHYSNLQPLWADENLKKKDKY